MEECVPLAFFHPIDLTPTTDLQPIQEFVVSMDGLISILSHIATLRKYGITSRFVQSYDVKEFEAEIDERTKAIYVEIITNSDGTLTDVKAMADVSHPYSQ